MFYFRSKRKVELQEWSDGVLNQARFHKLLYRERIRVDRNQHKFAVVVFFLRRSSTSIEQATNLIKLLSKEIRMVDEIGWLNSFLLGVFLPDTDKQGAFQFVRRVNRRMIEEQMIVDCATYCYPDDWLLPGKESDSASPKNGRSKSKLTVANSDSDQRSSIFSKQSSSKPNRMVLRVVEDLLFPPIPIAKRVIDIVLAGFLLLCLSPVFLIIATMIKLVSPGPVFFKQERIGYRGIPFTFWKFRTMKVNAPDRFHAEYMKKLIKSSQAGGGIPMEKLDNGRDPRIIRGGHFLRKTCLDELPQLFNVLKGDMSLVGPRPSLPYEVEHYSLWHRERFDILPGMTGFWQVSGKNKTTFRKMVQLDIRYSRKANLWFDFRLLLKTFPAIVGFIKGGSA